MSLDFAQEQLQNALITTFLANLSFLNEYDNNLFQRVDRLSQAINSGEYKENYALEFLTQDGDFDIYDINKQKYVYNKKPSKFNKNAYAKSDFTSKGSISVLDNELFQGKWFNVFDEVEYFCNFEYSNKKLANDILNYSKILRNNISDYRVKKYKYIDKFMFIGTLLGRHIPLIVEKLKAKDYFVCEKNLEIFRLSLFVVDYSILARNGNTVIFSIMDDEHKFMEQIEKFFSYKSYENYCIKYFTTDYEIQEYFDSIINMALANKGTTFNHYMMLENVWKNVSFRINNNKIIQILQKSNNEILQKPILFLGAGPSLSDNIQWVKDNKDKFIIVAIGATYKILSNHGINADIVTTMDPQYSVLNKKQFDKNSVKKIENSFVLAAINTDERILNRFNQQKTYLFEMLRPLHKNNICYRGFSVGEMSASILLALGFKNIFMLGLDLALNQKTGESHMSGYSSSNYEDFSQKKYQIESNEFSFKEELIEVKGNLLSKVYTNRLFALSLEAMNSNFAFIKKEYQNIFNLSNHGSFINKTVPLDISNINLENYKAIPFNEKENLILNYLEEISKNFLDSDDYMDLKKELEYINIIEQEFLTFKNQSSDSFEDFYNKCEKLVNYISYPNVHCSFLYVVFKNFFSIFLQYIFYCFNDQKIADENKKLIEVEKRFFEDFENTLNRYKEYLKKI